MLILWGKVLILFGIDTVSDTLRLGQTWEIATLRKAFNIS